MTNIHRRTRPEDHEFDLRWWLVPGVLALLVLAAVLAVPSLERRYTVRHAAAPQKAPEFVVDAIATSALNNLPQRQAPQGSAAPAAQTVDPNTEEDNHAATF